MKYIISIIIISCFTCFQPTNIKQSISHNEVIDNHVENHSRHVKKNIAPEVIKESHQASSQPTQRIKTSTTNNSNQTSNNKETTITNETSIFTSSQTNLVRNTLLSLINKERTSSITLYSPLLSSASLRAREAYQKWSHTRPNQTRWNTTLYNIIDINTILHGENLAKTQFVYQQAYTNDDIIFICQTLHDGLINSPTHYKVMTNTNYKKVNIGIYTQVDNNILKIVIAQHYIQ